MSENTEGAEAAPIPVKVTAEAEAAGEGAVAVAAEGGGGGGGEAPAEKAEAAEAPAEKAEAAEAPAEKAETTEKGANGGGNGNGTEEPASKRHKPSDEGDNDGKEEAAADADADSTKAKAEAEAAVKPVDAEPAAVSTAASTAAASTAPAGAPEEVHPDDEEDEAKAGGDAVPTSPSAPRTPSPTKKGGKATQRTSPLGAHDPTAEPARLERLAKCGEAPPPPRPPAPADWRETLFVWRGNLEYLQGKRRCNWVGSWAPQVSHDDGPPTARDFETHQENTFVLHRVLDKRIDLGRATDIPHVLYGRGLSWLGFYKLDQDDGKGRQRLVDFSHLFVVKPLDQPKHQHRHQNQHQHRYRQHHQEDNNDNDNDNDNGHREQDRVLGLVAAMGSNEFGNFVSAGLLTEEPPPVKEENQDQDQDQNPYNQHQRDQEPKLTMTLARRYITNKDPRNKWKTAKEVLKDLDQETLKKGDFWKCVPTKIIKEEDTVTV